MCSPAAFPSRQRAAPAKKRRLSTRKGTSARATVIGLPPFPPPPAPPPPPRHPLRPLAQPVRQLHQLQAALSGGSVGPAFEGRRGGFHSAVDILFRSPGYLRDRLFRNRVDDPP